jgi:hypothetical protein
MMMGTKYPRSTPKQLLVPRVASRLLWPSPYPLGIERPWHCIHAAVKTDLRQELPSMQVVVVPFFTSGFLRGRHF